MVSIRMTRKEAISYIYRHQEPKEFSKREIAAFPSGELQFMATELRDDGKIVALIAEEDKDIENDEDDADLFPDGIDWDARDEDFLGEPED